MRVRYHLKLCRFVNCSAPELHFSTRFFGSWPQKRRIASGPLLVLGGVRVMVRVRVRVVIKPIPLSRYPLARKGILFGGAAMEKSLDTRRR